MLKTPDSTPATVPDLPFGRPMIGEAEREAVMDVLSGPTLTHGPRVERFERDFAAFTGAPHAVATCSCTAGLHLAYLYMGLGPGDEVIVPAQTHVATAHSVELCGARCIFVDSEPRTGNLDLEQAEAKVTPRTRAIAVVHFLGVPVDMTTVLAMAAKHDLAVVEDCALAIGATWDGKHVGLHGDAGAFSFYPIKHITTGEGGMLISRRAELAAAAAQQRAFGIDRNVVADRPQPGEYDVVAPGHNYRLNEIAAAMGIEQMRRLPEFLDARRRNHEILTSALADVEGLEPAAPADPRGRSGCYCLNVYLAEELAPHRPAIMASLESRGVGVSVYYPRPVPAMSYFQGRYGHHDDEFPMAWRISRRAISLPVGPHLEEGDARYVAGMLREALTSVT